MSKHEIMQRYAVMLTFLCAVFVYGHGLIFAFGAPIVAMMQSIRGAWGRRGVALAILGFLGALLLTYGIRHL